MAKTNYKPGEKVKITKPGIFKDLEGEVVSTGQSALPIKVNCGIYGTWNFNFSQIELLNKNKNERTDNNKPGATKKTV